MIILILKFIIKKIFSLVILLFTISIVTFSLTYISSGNPARIIAEKNFARPTIEQINQIKEEYSFDKPIYYQYYIWISKFLKKDMGVSYSTSNTVYDEISQKILVSLKLSFISLNILIFIAIPLGIASAFFKDSLFEKICNIFSYVSISIPSFLVGLGVLYYLGVNLKIISILDRSSNNLLIPSFVLAFSDFGIIILMMQTSMKEILEKDYIKIAQFYGVNNFKILSKYALKNSILPVINKLGMILCSFLSSSAVVESIFSINGLGKLLLDSVSTKDVPIIQAFVIIMSTFIVLVNLLIDLVHKLIDPRIDLN